MILSKRYIPTITFDSLESNNSVPSSVCSRNRALYVIVSSSKGTSQLIQKLFVRLHSSEIRWLLFLDNSKNVEVALGGVDIPIDCEFLVASGCERVELTEVYRVNDRYPLHIAHWGQWTHENGLQTPSVGLYERRSNLLGTTFIAAVVHSPPFTNLSKDENGNLVMNGVFPELSYVISEKLNFSIVIRQPNDNSYGIKKKHESWTGAIGMMLANRVNLTVNVFQINEQRLDVVDFSIPVTKAKSCIFVRKISGLDSSYELFLSPFNISVWLAVIGVMGITACYMSFLHYLSHEHCHHRYSLLDAMLCVWGSFCGQGDSNPPEMLSGRVVHWTTFVTGFILLAAYSATITSSLTVPKISLPFTNLDGILHDDSYAFGVLQNQALYQQFQDAKHMTMREVFEKKLVPKKDDLPKTAMAGFYQTCERKFAFMTSNHDWLLLHNELPCDVSKLPEDELVYYVSLVLPKGSPYRRIINFMLQKILHAGIFHRLYNQWRTPLLDEDEITTRSVELEDVFPLLALCAGGYLLSIAILLFEICIANRYKSKNTMQYLP